MSAESFPVCVNSNFPGVAFPGGSSHFVFLRSLGWFGPCAVNEVHGWILQRSLRSLGLGSRGLLISLHAQGPQGFLLLGVDVVFSLRFLFER